MGRGEIGDRVVVMGGAMVMVTRMVMVTGATTVTINIPVITMAVLTRYTNAPTNDGAGTRCLGVVRGMCDRLTWKLPTTSYRRHKFRSHKGHFPKMISWYLFGRHGE